MGTGTISFKRNEWWILKTMFDKSFAEDDPENALELGVSNKIDATFKGATNKSKRYSLDLSERELWTLMNNYDASFDASDPENKLEAKIAEKISDAWADARGV